MRLQPERGLAHRTFHRGIDGVHLRGRDFLRNPEPRTKCFIHFRRTEQLKSHFLATRAIDTKKRRTRKPRMVFKQPQWLPVLPEGQAKYFYLDLERMVGDYLSLYDSLLVRGPAPRAQVRASGL